MKATRANAHSGSAHQVGPGRPTTRGRGVPQMGPGPAHYMGPSRPTRWGRVGPLHGADLLKKGEEGDVYRVDDRLSPPSPHSSLRSGGSGSSRGEINSGMAVQR